MLLCPVRKTIKIYSRYLLADWMYTRPAQPAAPVARDAVWFLSAEGMEMRKHL